MRHILVLVFLVTLGFTQVKAEEESAANTVTPYAYEKELARIENYLNNIGNLVADFTQIAPDGEISTGKFYLSRPGKLRWQYDPPTPILIVANGNVISYYDYELDQVSHVTVNSTLAGVLTRKEIRFTDDVEVSDVKNEDKVLYLTLAMKNKPEEGKLTLVFSDKPLTMRKMIVTDANGKVTNISFDNPVTAQELDKELFNIDNKKLNRG